MEINWPVVSELVREGVLLLALIFLSAHLNNLTQRVKALEIAQTFGAPND